MKITGKHEYELPVAVEFEIESAPKIEQIDPTALRVEIKAKLRKIKRTARTIKKDTKRLLRTLEKMKRHGWRVVDQLDDDAPKIGATGAWAPVTCWYCGKLIKKRSDGYMHRLAGNAGALVHHACHLKLHEKHPKEGEA